MASRITQVVKATGSISSTPRQPGMNIETMCTPCDTPMAPTSSQLALSGMRKAERVFGPDVEGVDILEEHQQQEKQVARVERLVVHFGGQHPEHDEADDAHVQTRDQHFLDHQPV